MPPTCNFAPGSYGQCCGDKFTVRQCFGRLTSLVCHNPVIWMRPSTRSLVLVVAPTTRPLNLGAFVFEGPKTIYRPRPTIYAQVRGGKDGPRTNKLMSWTFSTIVVRLGYCEARETIPVWDSFSHLLLL